MTAERGARGENKLPSVPKRVMVWGDYHDGILCKEIIAAEIFLDTKKGTVQRSTKWAEVADSLSAIKELPEGVCPFRVDKRAVRDRYTLLADRLRRKLKHEVGASGISPEMTQTEQGLEYLIQKEDASDEIKKLGRDTKKDVTAERAKAEEVRKRAMENMGATKKRATEGQGGADSQGKRKRLSSSTDTIAFLKEKNERQVQMVTAEMELKKQHLEFEAKRHNDLMASMQRQNQLQQHTLQMMMEKQEQQQFQMQKQQSELLMKIFEKISK